MTSLVRVVQNFLVCVLSTVIFEELRRCTRYIILMGNMVLWALPIPGTLGLALGRQ